MVRLSFFRTFSSLSLKSQKPGHIPALLNEVMQIFNLSTRTTVFDLTFGYGGHSKAMLQSKKDLNLLAFDRDAVAISYATDLKNSYPQLKPIKGKFSDLNKLCEESNIKEKTVDFILMDLGCSSMQMDNGDRGFSLSKNAKLDMRMDQHSGDISAIDVVNNLGVAQLADIFKKYGEESESRNIAKTIVEYRTTVGPILTTHQLKDLVFQLVRRTNIDAIGRKAHPATLIFQALRIFVNDELNELCSGLTFAEKFLKPVTGCCVVISFHSLEDRLVKWAFHGKDFCGIDKSIQKLLKGDELKPTFVWTQEGDVITPSYEEIKRNPRVRSAKMRVGKIVSD